MQPVDLHCALLSALPRRRRPLSLDEILSLLPDAEARAGDVARWLEWAEREHRLADAGERDGRRCYVVRGLGGRRRRHALLLRGSIPRRATAVGA